MKNKLRKLKIALWLLPPSPEVLEALAAIYEVLDEIHNTTHSEHERTKQNISAGRNASSTQDQDGPSAT